MSPEELQQCRDCVPPDAELRGAWPYRAIVLLLDEVALYRRLTYAWLDVMQLITSETERGR